MGKKRELKIRILSLIKIYRFWEQSENIFKSENRAEESSISFSHIYSGVGSTVVIS